MIQNTRESNLSSFLLKLVIFSIPFNGLGSPIPKLGLTLFITLLYILSNPFRLFIYSRANIKPVLILIFLYTYILGISLIYSTHAKGASYSFLTQFPLYIIFFYVLLKNFTNNLISLRQGMQLYVLAVGLTTTLFFLKIGVSISEDGRLAILGVNSNLLAVQNSLSIIFIISLLHKSSLSLLKKYFYLMLIPALLYTSVLTGSRGGFLGLLLGIFVYYYFSKSWKAGKIKNIFIGVLGIVILSIFFLSNDVMYTRFFEQDESLSASRMPIWEAAYGIVKDDLIFGVGVFRYQNEMPKMMGKLFSIHNEFLTILVYSGLIGILAFLWFIRLAAKSSFKALLRFENPVFLSVFSIIIFALFKGGGMILRVDTWFIISLVMASQFILQNIKSSN